MNDNAKATKLLIPFATVQQTLFEILLTLNVPREKAEVCAHVFATNSLEGVYSHGINRFSRFAGLVERSIIKVNNDPVCIHRSGAIEQWHGQSGIGITNALASIERAMALANSFGMGCVALAHTNHWMRAGYYARRAAEKGYACMLWSNTIANTPAWGSMQPRLGNNPLAVGIPFNNAPVVLDMAMSQFSYGALEEYVTNGKQLPVPGGFAEDGKLTTDPASILKTRSTLPIGYWKGSALSLVLDILAAILSNGLPVAEISKQSDETNVSQVFIAFNLNSLTNYSSITSKIEQIILDVKESPLIHPDGTIRYPGESVLQIKSQNLQEGIPVREDIWNEIMKRHESGRV